MRLKKKVPQTCPKIQGGWSRWYSKNPKLSCFSYLVVSLSSLYVPLPVCFLAGSITSVLRANRGQSGLARCLYTNQTGQTTLITDPPPTSFTALLKYFNYFKKYIAGSITSVLRDPVPIGGSQDWQGVGKQTRRVRLY